MEDVRGAVMRDRVAPRPLRLSYLCSFWRPWVLTMWGCCADLKEAFQAGNSGAVPHRMRLPALTGTPPAGVGKGGQHEDEAMEAVLPCLCLACLSCLKKHLLDKGRD